jgi:hypothetical protein
MGFNVQINGLDRLNRKAPRLSRDLKSAVVDQIHRDVRRMEVDMLTRAVALGTLARIAAVTIRAPLNSNGGTIAGGGRSGLPGLLFMGSEFGGQKRRRTYAGRRGEQFYLIKRRRTTMMFHPHVGRRGYFYFPTLRRDLRGLHRRLADAMGEGWRR